MRVYSGGCLFPLVFRQINGDNRLFFPKGDSFLWVRRAFEDLFETNTRQPSAFPVSLFRKEEGEVSSIRKTAFPESLASF